MPTDIGIELRIYQSNQIKACNPASDEIALIMDKIIIADKAIKKTKEQEG